MSKHFRIVANRPQTDMKLCRICGQVIEDRCFICISGGRIKPKYYHKDCYPTDSRPKKLIEA